MGCEVCIGGDVDYDGHNEFYEERWQKARKPHRCCECREEVPIGQQYQVIAYKFDGVLSAHKTCAACADVRTVFSCGEDPPYFGELWPTMRGMAFDSLTTASECFIQLSTAGKEKALAEWRKWKGLAACSNQKK